MIHTIFNLAVVGGRFLLGFIIFTAGMGKVTYGDYFPLTMFPMSLERLLAPHGLALLGVFIAWSQVVIGLLLLSQRFATIGAIMCVPLISNILVVTISLGFKGTPYLNTFLLCLNLFLLAADYHKLKFLFMDDISAAKEIPLSRNNLNIDLLWITGIVFCLAAAALHPVSRYLTFSLSAVGIIVFLACGVWHVLTRRNLVV